MDKAGILCQVKGVVGVRGAFWLGLVTGLLLAAAGLGMAAHVAARQGVTVHVDAATLSGTASAAVKEALRRELPRATAELRRQLPAKVAEGLARRFRETGIVVYGVRLDVPEPAVQAFRRNLETELARQLEAELAPERLTGLADEWSRELERRVLSALAGSLENRPLSARPVERLPLAIPVIIRLQPDPDRSPALRDVSPAAGPAGRTLPLPIRLLGAPGGL